MKIERNLSGIYFRYYDDAQSKWTNRTFEDLSEEEQDHHMKDRSIEWLQSLAKSLANVLNEIGEQFDLAKD